MGNIEKIAKYSGATAGESIIELILTDLYNYAKKKAGQQIKLWQIRSYVKKLKSEVHKIRMVKTLWQVDKAIDIRQFYCDSYLIFNKKRTLVRTLADLGDRKHILITGIAGQGKSIFLRYICSNALEAGQCIPVFIELRRILSNESLLDHIKRFLGQVGIKDIDDSFLNVLLSSGKIVLFLDGFDEVAEPDKPTTIREVERLSLTHDSLRVIVTSRPESGMEVSPVFDVVPLSDLIGSEYKGFIHKLSDDPILASSLIKQIESHKSNLSDLLCTPLLVTLLVMSYKSFQELPEQLSEFYDSIFQVLLQRHDGAKPGFKRPRRCSFNDNQYRSVFEGLCYESKAKITSMFNYDDIERFANSSLSKHKLGSCADRYIEDIINVTCLLLREGREYRFIHRSVREYYAAAFIKHRPDPVAKIFYSRKLDLLFLRTWKQELLFLSEIDRYRYNKYFFFPYLCRILGCPETDLPPEAPAPSLSHTLRLFADCVIGFLPPDSRLYGALGFYLSPFVPFKYYNRIFRLNYSPIEPAIEGNRIVANSLPENCPKSMITEYKYRVRFRQILEAGFLINELNQIAGDIFKESYSQAVAAKELILSEESFDIALDINIE